MRTSTGLLILCAAIVAAAPIVGAPGASAQCTITGPTQVCPGDSIELCAPPLENVTYLWQGPDGVMYMTDCILVFEPGLYTLRMRDQDTRIWTEPCSLTVRSNRAEAPAVTGAASTCAGTPAEWCGPSGGFEYAWNGPNGFAASTACVTLTEAGEYSLRVRSLPDGCWGDSTARSLSVTSCGPSSTNCPRPAWWWAHQCSSGDRAQGRIARTQLASVASCVDEHAASLAWSDDVVGFTRTVKHERHTLRMRARRQFAAVWANVCASQYGVSPLSGPAVTLDPSTPIDPSLGGGSVGSWLAFADAELARLDVMSGGQRSVKRAYQALIRTGWHINHGRGLGRTCQTDLSTDARLAAEAGEAASEADPEPLDAELVEVVDGALALGAADPNPFSSQTTLAFSVSTSEAAQVSIAVYDVGGRLIRELARGPYAPGRYVVRWDGTADNGVRVRSGLYFIRGRVGGQDVQSRVSLIR